MGKVADRYFLIDPWEVREEGFDPAHAQVSESIFSLGNEYMGVRGYFEEGYSGKSLQGSYINGIYERRALPKSGYRGMLPYTEFMVNTVDFLYTRIRCNGAALDLCTSAVSEFTRTLSLRTGILTRSFVWQADEHTRLRLSFERFLSMARPDTAGQRITFTALTGAAALSVEAGLDFSRPHCSSDDNFWTVYEKKSGALCAAAGVTRGTGQKVRALALFSGMEAGAPREEEKLAAAVFEKTLRSGETAALTRIAVVTAAKDAQGERTFPMRCRAAGDAIGSLGYDALRAAHAQWWADRWRLSDITIEGDDEIQQGIRYCVFQLHQTLHTADHSAIIGAKGLTGESYNGNTFWDTEVFCLPFYLFNNPAAARSILQFRYDTLPQARERARALDCRGAFYPVATISGTECCDLWQHASLQLQASTGVVYGLWCYAELTGDAAFLYEKGAEILVEVSRMLSSRGDWADGEYGFYGVMGPDEFQMMVHNNAYTNFMAKETFLYALGVLREMETACPDLRAALVKKTGLQDGELAAWSEMAAHMRIPCDPETGLFEQHEGFFRLPHLDVDQIPVEDFPLYSHWSYERIYRNDMLKQPDVLMFMLLHGQKFTLRQLAVNYDYYEPRCIHESSLSPSVHSILASRLGRGKEAYELFRFAARLDLDNYNRNTDEGLHITSIAGSWLNIVYGFAGLSFDGGELALSPAIPDGWQGYSFRLLHQGHTLSVGVTRQAVTLCADAPVTLTVYGRRVGVGETPLSIPSEAGERA